MNNKLIILTLLIIILSYSINAVDFNGHTTILDYPGNITTTENENDYFDCTGSMGATLYVANDPYIGVNETDAIKVYYETETDFAIMDINTSVVIVLDNKSYNMTFVNDSVRPYWVSYTKSNASDDITYLIEAYSPIYLCLNHTETIKFRVPFYVTIHLYRSANNYTDAEPYTNEFQYIYLRATNVTEPLIRDLTYLDNFFIKVHFPFYRRTFTATADNTISYWDKYDTGEATIKLYETGDYSINLLTTDVTGINWPYEFIYPQFSNEIYKSRIKDSVTFSTLVNYNMNVYVDMWEINKFNVMMNWVKWLAIVVIWIVLTILILMATQWNWQIAAGFIIVYWLLITILSRVIF